MSTAAEAAPTVNSRSRHKAVRRRNTVGSDTDLPLSSLRVAATLSTAAAAGLTSGRKDKRLSGRAHEKLVAAAAARSGLTGSELLEYALAKVALEDDFVEHLLARKGSIDPAIELDF